MSTIVIGGGLAGLTTAAILADRGEQVTVLERRGRLGGRAATDERKGHLFNQGPHALYLGGEGLVVLRRLGIDPPGGTPPFKGALGVAGGRFGLVPVGAGSLVRSPWVKAGDWVELARLLGGRLGRVDAVPLADRSASSWLAGTVRSERNRALVAGLMRVATYCADLDHLSADVGVAQFQLALKGVRYLDGGWQSLIDRLAERATGAGAVVRTGVMVDRVRAEGSGVAVETQTGSEQADRAVVAVSSPALAARLTGSAELDRWSANAVPVTAATLEVGLRRLPFPARRFAYGLDRPLYYSVHNPPADLGAGVTLHVMRYLHPDDNDTAAEVRAELEALLDLLQPGWRDQVDIVGFQRRLTVSNAMPTAVTGGAAGRFPSALPDVPGVFVAGDWVGPTGHLADASIASATVAAELALDARLVAA